MKKQELHFSRLLSLALSLALLCTAISVPLSVNATNGGTDPTKTGTSATNLWGGTAADVDDLELEDSTKDNSADNPYLIDCAEKLAYIARAGSTATKGKYYELTCDIYLNKVTDFQGDNWYDAENEPKQWFDSTVISGIQFNGHLNGNGKKIYGIYINDSTRSNVGLFMSTKGDASVSNLGIENSYINAQSNVGAIFGWKDNFSSLTLSNCYSSDTVILTASGNNAGGLIGLLNTQSSIQNGYAANATIIIENCYSSAPVSGSAKVGGLIGEVYAVSTEDHLTFSITNCYSTQTDKGLMGSISASARLNEIATFRNNYSTKAIENFSSSLTVAKMTGDYAYENMPGYDFNNVWQVIEGGTPKLRVFGIKVWDGSVATKLSLKDPNNKTNSKNNPYLISNGAELAYLVQYGVYDVGTNDFGDKPVFKTQGQYFELTNDIYLNDVSENWYDSAYASDRNGLKKWTNYMSHEYTQGEKKYKEKTAFSGTLDGKGHKIYGLCMDNSTLNVGGLFGYGNNFTIKNLGIEKSYISVDTGKNASVGAIMAVYEWGSATFNQCYVSDTVYLNGYKAGGLLGYTGNNNCNVQMTNCYSSADFGNTTTIKGGLIAIGMLEANTSIQSPNTPTKYSFKNCYNTQENMFFVGQRFNGIYTFTNSFTTLRPDFNIVKSYGSGDFTVCTPDNMLDNGMTNLVNAVDSEEKPVWVTSPKSTPKLRVFPIPGNAYEADKEVNILDLVVAKKCQLGKMTDYSKVDLTAGDVINTDKSYRIDEDDISEIKKILLFSIEPVVLNNENVKVTEGRALNMGFGLDKSASSIEFKSTGCTEIYLNGSCRNATKDIYFTVYIDGAPQSKRVKFAKDASSVCIAEGLNSANTYNIKLVRENEETDGRFYAYSLNLGYFGKLCDRPADNKLYIEFIGDSTTCGSAPSSENASDAGVTNTYAYRAGQALSADCNFIAKSDIKVAEMSNYFATRKSTTRTPNLVVINLGTNDSTATVNEDNFKNGVKDLIGKVKEAYGQDTKIIWATSLTGNYNTCIENVINEYNNDNVRLCSGLAENPEAAKITLVNYITNNKILATEEAALAKPEYIPEDYSLVWYDGFSADSLDSSKWTQTPAMGDDPRYAPQVTVTKGEKNLTVRDGNAVMSAKKEGDNEYTANESLTTMNRMAFKYGYLEMKAKVPFGQAAWPSFWLKSNGNIDGTIRNAQYMTEVDVFEVFASTTDLYANIHKWYPDKRVMASEVNQSLLAYSFDSEDVAAEYHIYGMKWTQNEIEFYVDGVEFASQSLTKDFEIDSETGAGKEEKISGLEDYLYILLNCHILESKIGDFKDTINYKVDYIRLYQNSSDNGGIYYGNLPTK